MAYADYSFYNETYKGKLSEADFSRLSERASDYIDSRTGYILQKGVPSELETRVKKACCAVAEVMKQNEVGGIMTSERVGDYSVSYAATSQRTSEQKLDDAVQLYLSDLVKNVRWL